MAHCDWCGRDSFKRHNPETNLRWICTECEGHRAQVIIPRRAVLDYMPYAGLTFALAVILAVPAVFGS